MSDADNRRPEWSHEDCVEYEVARETITHLAAFRSAWIAAEEAKPAPDSAAIARWQAERTAYVMELRGLHALDRANISRICTEYGAQVKALSAAEPCRARLTG
jgi:hypothetical protein